MAPPLAPPPSPKTQQAAWLTFVVIGAGPTGVELAGALSEIARQTMLKDFRRINPASARVLLLEGRERVLPPYPPDLREGAEAARAPRRRGHDERHRHRRHRS